ncbi:MAG: aminotransferase class IV, partial [Propionibacteriales bacterium]|nr:aminotransferase class IV [Propionibacteriales bacterium]
PTVDDVVLINARGHVTETSVANLAVRLDGQWWTPPLTDGCLPGVERGLRLDDGTLHERTLRPQDLRRAEEIAVISSLRGWRSATLEVDHGPR